MLVKAALLLAVLVVVVWVLWNKRTAQQKIQMDGPVSSWVIPDQWSVASGMREGKPIITRFNMGLHAVIGHPSFRKQVGIAVPFSHARNNGLPGTEEDKQLSDLENEILRRFSVGNESLFAGAITTAGMREFVLYTSDETAARAKAQQLVREATHYNVQFVVNDDPEWNVFKTLSGH